jgi:hypothetical protein
MASKKRFFPESIINTVNGNGFALTDDKQGVWVEIHERNGKPVSAEVYSDDQEEYVDIGLSFEGKELSDYDGVFSLPKEVAVMLKEMGFKVDPIMMGCE